MMRFFFFFLVFLLAGEVCAVAVDCNEIGRRVAVKQGGELADVETVLQDGRMICVIIVRVPGRNGEKPRRVEVAVPVR